MIKEVVKILETSCKNGLNANLTPEECRELLLFLKALHSRCLTLKKSVSFVDQITDSFSKLAHNLIDEITYDFKKKG